MNVNKWGFKVIVPAGLALASCASASGPVGTYACPHNGCTDMLELTSDGKANWTFGLGGETRAYRYEEKEGDIKIFNIVDPAATAKMSPMDKWRQQGAMDHPQWRYKLQDGKLINLTNEERNCERS